MKPQARTAATAFLAVLLLNGCIYLFLLSDGRIVRGHETWEYYALQHAFLSEAGGGGAPLWLPYAAQGTASSGAAFVQGGLFQNVLLLAGGAFRAADFHLLFHLGMMLDETLFLVGVWLLARRLFRSVPAAFFTSVAAAGSCMWAENVWISFHSFYAVPLVISLVHDFLDGGDRRSLFLACSLAILQAVGSPFASAAMLFVAVPLTFLGWRWIAGAPFQRAAPRGPWRASDKAAVLMVAALLVAVVAAGLWGFGSFVRPGSDVPPFSWAALAVLPHSALDLLVGLSPSIDYTLFCGSFTVACAVLAGFRMAVRKTLIIALLAAVFVNLTALVHGLGGMLLALYPPSDAFTHAAPFLRLLVIFVAGFGFRELVEGRVKRAVILPTAGVCVVVGFGLSTLSGGAPVNYEFYQLIRPVAETLPAGSANLDLKFDPLVSELLAAAAMGAAMTGGCLLLWGASTRTARLALALALVLHPLELFSWKSRTFWIKTFSMTAEQAALQRLEPAPWRPRRTADLGSSDRFQAMQSRTHPLFPAAQPSHGRASWTTGAYWFADLPDSAGRTAYWMGPLDGLMNAWASEPVHRDGVLTFPRGRPAAAKLIGLEADKLSVFTRAHAVGSDEQLSAHLADPAFGGDVLLVSGESSGPPVPLSALSANERLDAPVLVTAFSANALTVHVQLPAGHRGAWLSYADVWDPGWTATVNGKEAAVGKAFLAYKAVALEPGRNRVEFRYHAPLRAYGHLVIGLCSLVWIVLGLWAAARLIAGRPGFPGERRIHDAS